MIKLSVVITHHRTPELMGLCIKSIQDTIKDLNYEIIVVDGEAQEKNQEFIKSNYPNIRLISFKKNVGYSKMVNAGIKEAIGEYVLILNADIIVLENAILEMIKLLEQDAKIGIVGPQLLDFTNNIQISCFSNPTLKAVIARRTLWGKTRWSKNTLNKFIISDWDKKTKREVDWLQGSAMMFRKKTIEQIGPWDEKFFMYFEDADWCRRFWQNGFKVVYLPNAKMVHYYHRSSKKYGAMLDIIFNKYARTHLKSALLYFKKYGF